MKVRVAVCAGLALGLGHLAGCGGAGDFPTAKVTGSVLCEGQPVPGAMVYFEPIHGGGQESSALVGKQGFAFTDAQGQFTLSTYAPGQGDGAVVGMHRVRVGKGDAKCPCAMNEEVDLTQVEVKAGTTNEFELVLKKATAQELKLAKLQEDPDDE